MKRGGFLALLILLGLLGGVAYGQFALLGSMGDDPDGHWTRQAGDLLLIRPLMLLIIPLVFVSVVVGMTSIGDPSKLGVIGSATLLYYLSTMLVAVVIGAILVTAFRPGDLPDDVRAALRGEAGREFASAAVASDIEQAQREGTSRLGGAWLNILRQMVPDNILQEMARGRTLGVIVFAVLLGLGLAAGGEATRPAVRFFEAFFDAMMRLVGWVIWLTPVGVFLLVAWTVGKVGLGELIGPLGRYVLLVLVGLAIHGLLVLPLILKIFGRSNPYRFMWQMRRALLTAFGTDSSSATLPVTIECAECEGGCSRRAANFVLPLGATVNMDGTALYEAVAVVFLFQLWGIDLSFSQLLIVAITATLAAVGAAGIPSAGTVTMIIVISAVNDGLTAEGGAAQQLPVAAIGVILGVDRIVDMCRTTVNVWGDAVGSKIMTRLAPD
jgi:Na+/H+-dicarboxylate symporter